MLIAVNKVAGPDSSEEVRQRTIQGFSHAAPVMKQFKGYLGMELWTQEDGAVLAVSRWESKEALKEYTESPLFRSHHGSTATNSDAEKQGSSVTYYEANVLP